MAVDTPRVPAPPLVFTNPFVVRFESVAMFCEVFTVTVLTVRVSPVENVRADSLAEKLFQSLADK